MSVNAVRGEVEVAIGDVTLVLAADMDGLARLSAATGSPTFHELYARLAGAELFTSVAAIRLLTVRGKHGKEELPKAPAAEAACTQLRLNDLKALQEAFEKLLAGLMRPAKDDEKPKPGEDERKNG